MFPPTHAPDIATLLERLGQSLSRGGDNWSGQYAVTSTGDEELGDRVAYQLNSRLPRVCKPFLTAYIKDYTFHSGWISTHFRYYRNRVEFNCSPAMRS